jgi:hypothetical protein
MAHGLSIGRRRYTPARRLQQEMAADPQRSAVWQNFRSPVDFELVTKLGRASCCGGAKPEKRGATLNSRQGTPQLPQYFTGYAGPSTRIGKPLNPKGSRHLAAQTCPARWQDISQRPHNSEGKPTIQSAAASSALMTQFY